MEEYNIIPTFKISIVGDSSIGKSCLIYRYVENKFDDFSLPTVGLDFFSKKINIHGEEYKLHIFDMAGQERFRSIVTSYYRRNNGIILAFDITNKESFDNLKRWVSEIDKYSDTNVCLVLIGTKLDMGEKREVFYSDAMDYANCLKINYYEVSSKDNINVEKIFIDLVGQIKLILEIKTETEKSIKLNSVRKSKYCCKN